MNAKKLFLISLFALFGAGLSLLFPSDIEASPLNRDKAVLGRAEAAFKAKNYRVSFRLFLRAARGGSPVAQTYVGMHYLKAWGVSKNPGKALIWFSRAALRGYPRAETALGMMYASGLGVPRDFKKARFWLHKAARAGDKNAARWLDSIKGVSPKPSSVKKPPETSRAPPKPPRPLPKISPAAPAASISSAPLVFPPHPKAPHLARKNKSPFYFSGGLDPFLAASADTAGGNSFAGAGLGAFGNVGWKRWDLELGYNFLFESGLKSGLTPQYQNVRFFNLIPKFKVSPGAQFGLGFGDFSSSSSLHGPGAVFSAVFPLEKILRMKGFYPIHLASSFEAFWVPDSERLFGILFGLRLGLDKK